MPAALAGYSGRAPRETRACYKLGLRVLAGAVQGASVVPTLRYRDLDSSVDWLCAAFGFSPHTVHRDADGLVRGAHLVNGAGMIMLAPVGDGVFDELMKQPDEIGGAETQSCYFVIADADTHYATAVAHGADVVLELQNFEHGGRGYLCRDLEGHLWSFGTFDPWSGAVAAPSPDHGPASWIKTLPAMATARPATLLAIPGAMLALAVAAVAWWPVTSTSDNGVQAALDSERVARVEAERKTGVAEQELARLRQDRDAGDLDADKLQEELAHLASAKEQAETAHRTSDAAIKDLTSQVSQLQRAKAAAERSMRHLMARAIRDRQAIERGRRQAAALSAASAAQKQAAGRSGEAVQALKERHDRELSARKEAEASRARIEQLLAEEREAKAQAEVALQQVSEQLKQEQSARRAAELGQEKAAVPAPRPAVRPDAPSGDGSTE
jgi:uncharacterized glyoxalase superfamily protein PhnB